MEKNVIPTEFYFVFYLFTPHSAIATYGATNISSLRDFFEKKIFRFLKKNRNFNKNFFLSDFVWFIWFVCLFRSKIKKDSQSHLFLKFSQFVFLYYLFCNVSSCASSFFISADNSALWFSFAFNLAIFSFKSFSDCSTAELLFIAFP